MWFGFMPFAVACLANRLELARCFGGRVQAA